MTVCKFVLMKGKRSGEKCGKKTSGDYCKPHSKHEPKNEIVFDFKRISAEESLEEDCFSFSF